MDTEELEPLDRVTATFQPRRTDDLKLGVDGWIGWRGTWQAVWRIEEGENAEYGGMLAFSPDTDPAGERPPFAWVPECDLRIEALCD